MRAIVHDVRVHFNHRNFIRRRERDSRYVCINKTDSVVLFSALAATCPNRAIKGFIKHSTAHSHAPLSSSPSKFIFSLSPFFSAAAIPFELNRAYPRWLRVQSTPQNFPSLTGTSTQTRFFPEPHFIQLAAVFNYRRGIYIGISRMSAISCDPITACALRGDLEKGKNWDSVRKFNSLTLH